SYSYREQRGPLPAVCRRGGRAEPRPGRIEPGTGHDAAGFRRGAGTPVGRDDGTPSSAGGRAASAGGRKRARGEGGADRERDQALRERGGRGDPDPRLPSGVVSQEGRGSSRRRGRPR